VKPPEVNTGVEAIAGVAPKEPNTKVTPLAVVAVPRVKVNTPLAEIVLAG
jgi:hypothetical protein